MKLILIFICSSALAIFIIIKGFLAKQKIFAQNGCQMTYSSRAKERIYIEDNSNSEYKLWKISNPNSSILNKSPVLFIPGHMGRLTRE